MVLRDKPAAKSCQSLAEDLVLYYYGELSESARRNCEAHLNDCQACRATLAEMSQLLPLTVADDAPPQAFWNDYSREMRRKLESATERQSWWRTAGALFRSTPLPALATGAVLLLVLALTLGRGFWQTPGPAPDDESLMEVLPIAERLDFFSNMELLDNMELLEMLSSQANGDA